MREVSGLTKLSCQERMDNIRKQCDEFDKKTEGIYKCLKPVEAEGYILQEPRVIMGTKRRTTPLDGKIKIENVGAKEKARFEEWYMFALDDYEEQAKRMVKSIKRASLSLGIFMEDPVTFLLESRQAKGWIRAIDEELTSCKE